MTRRTFLARAGVVSVSLAGRAQPAPDEPRHYPVKQFGAVGDGIALDTGAIQRAIDAAGSTGGGVVQFPAGRFVLGTILLKSGVVLSLDANTTLLGSLDPADYPVLEPFVDGVGTPRGYALIGCVDADHTGIVGAGTIDGRGAALQAAGGKGPAARPFLLLCVRSTRIAIEGVRLLNSSAWTMHLFQCMDVTIKRVTIRSLGLANNDGIDIDSSQRVRVEQATIDSGDDAICLKTTSTRPCRDITITGCTLTTRCAAFKIGTETAGDISKIRVTDCQVIAANLGAVKILSVDGAHIEDVVVERMQVDDTDTPIFLRLGARGRTYRSGDVARPAGTLANIAVRDLKVLRARRVGILIAGIPGHTVDQITLERIEITMVGDPVLSTPVEPAEMPAAYPEVRMFGANLPSSAIFARHLRGLHMDGVNVSTIAGDTRPHQLLIDDQPKPD